MLLIAGAVIVVVAAIAIFALMPKTAPGTVGSPSQQSGAGTTPSGGATSGSGSGAGSAAGQGSGGLPQNVNVQTPTCGTGNSCLSQSEMSALIGAGTYNAIYTNDPTTISMMYGSSGQNGTFLNGNVTAMWLIGYNHTTSGYLGSVGILEFVFQSPIARTLYAKELAADTATSFNVTNATSNGLTYSYSGGSAFINATILVGYKNDKLVQFLALGKYVPEAQLVSAISGDLQ